MGVCWIGYKIHVTESCDVDMTEPIHKALADKGKLPGEHFVDNGYVDVELLWRNILWI